MKTNQQSQQNSKWVEKELGEVVSFFNGKAHENVISTDGKYIVINSKFVSTNGVIAKYTDTCLSPLKKGDVAMVMSDVPNGKTIAKCFLVDEDYKYSLNQRIGGFKSDDIISPFLYYLLNRNAYFLAFDDGVNQTNLRKDDILECPLYYPPLVEQKRIVSVLETWDASIEKLTQKVSAKRQIKKALMQDLLTGKKRIAGFSDAWVTIHVGEIFTFLRSYAVSREYLENNTSNTEGVGNIHYGDIHSTYGSSSIDLRHISVPQIKDANFKFDKNDLLISGDLIMADVSEDYEGIGATVSIHELNSKEILGGLHTFILRDKSKKTAEKYRRYIFQNEEVRNKLRKIANGVSVYGISKSNLSKIQLDLPSLQEQVLIADILITADKEITELQKKLSILKEQKKYLLNNLITGTIRTPETLSVKITS
jgi:type I restriction enzyme, S subunit